MTNVTAFFRWYDLWIGAYIDRPNRTIYVCPLPMIGFRIRFGEASESGQPQEARDE